MDNNNNDTQKYCTRCRTYKHIDFFNRIIKRKDYYIDCDELGNSLYLKDTKLCLECRIILRNKIIK
jgi:hypothetical protein